MTVQLPSSKRIVVQKRKELCRKLHWVLTLTTLLVCIPSYLQTRNLRALMTNGDRSETILLDLSHTVPTAWDIPKRNNTAQVSSSASSVPLNIPSSQHQGSSSSLPPPPYNGTVTRKWAYAFLLGGCNAAEPEYRGFLYNIMMVARRLRKMGSQADMVLLIQMSYRSIDKTLPAQEEKMLHDLDIKFSYIPAFVSATHETFYALMMEKFRILELAGQYSRVMFLDSDQWPLCSLDYLFEMSEPPAGQTPLLKENMLLAWKWEPCNGGFFMFAPKQGDYELISSIIRRREEEALAMKYPYWNVTTGWGHTFSEMDKWKCPKDPVAANVGLEWGWHGAFTDQGLIYYWAKYVKQSVSIFIVDEVEHWGGCGGSACMESKGPSKLEKLSCRKENLQVHLPSNEPYTSIFHMSGKTKPWVQRTDEYSPIKTPWFQELRQMEMDLLSHDDLTAQIAKLIERKKPPTVGSYPVYSQMYEHLQDKKRRNWNPYQTEEEYGDVF